MVAPTGTVTVPLVGMALVFRKLSAPALIVVPPL